jgi:AcrR family transcriptional regulator
VHDAVLDVTLRLVAERGYAFSVDDVAAAAGVHKTTIYRNWTTKAALVAAAIDRLAAAEIVVPRTGDALADLAALATSVGRTLRSPAGAQAIRAVVAAAADDTELVESARRFLGERYGVAVALVEEGVEQGALRAGTDPLLVWQAIVNPLHMRAILGEPASDVVVAELVELVLAGARAR